MSFLFGKFVTDTCGLFFVMQETTMPQALNVIRQLHQYYPVATVWLTIHVFFHFRAMASNQRYRNQKPSGSYTTSPPKNGRRVVSVENVNQLSAESKPRADEITKAIELHVHKFVIQQPKEAREQLSKDALVSSHLKVYEWLSKTQAHKGKS